MALPLTGQLGTAALGSLELGTPPIFGTYVPHRGRPRGSISVANPRATISRTAPRGSISVANPRSEVGSG